MKIRPSLLAGLLATLLAVSALTLGALAAPPAQVIQATERLRGRQVFAADQYPAVPARLDGATGVDIDGEIDRNRARMEQIQRPDVERPAREIDAAGGFGDDLHWSDGTRGNDNTPFPRAKAAAPSAAG